MAVRSCKTRQGRAEFNVTNYPGVIVIKPLRAGPYDYGFTRQCLRCPCRKFNRAGTDLWDCQRPVAVAGRCRPDQRRKLPAAPVPIEASTAWASSPPIRPRPMKATDARV